MLSTYEASYTHFAKLPADDAWKVEILGGYFPRPMVSVDGATMLPDSAVVVRNREHWSIVGSWAIVLF